MNKLCWVLMIPLVYMYFATACSVIEKPEFKPKSLPPIVRKARLNPKLIESNVCFSKDDYFKVIMMKNDLINYIDYQERLIDEMHNFYAKKGLD